MDDNSHGLTESERFHFDLAGFLVRPAILTKDEVARTISMMNEIPYGYRKKPDFNENCHLPDLKKRNINLILLNARITKKSFNNWKLIENFSKSLLSKFQTCLTQNTETNDFLSKEFLFF